MGSANGLLKLDLPGGGPPNLPAGGPLSIQGGTSDDQLIREDIERAIDEQLAEKGLTKVEKDGDLLVAYHAAIREEKSINLNGMGWGTEVGEVGALTGECWTPPVTDNFYHPHRDASGGPL